MMSDMCKMVRVNPARTQLLQNLGTLFCLGPILFQVFGGQIQTTDLLIRILCEFHSLKNIAFGVQFKSLFTRNINLNVIKIILARQFANT